MSTHSGRTHSVREHETTSREKKVLLIAFIILIAIIVIAIASYLTYSFLVKEQTVRVLSGDQQQLIDTLGYPEQFTIAYLPRESADSNSAAAKKISGNVNDDQLVRTEVWYYPFHQSKVSFVDGKIVSTEEYKTHSGSVSYPNLKPEQFTDSMDLAQIKQQIGEDVNEASAGPNLELEFNVKTYINRNAVFSLYEGKLVYIQTVGIGVSE